MTVDLDAIKARLAAATPGPWSHDEPYLRAIRNRSGTEVASAHISYGGTGRGAWFPDADLIAHAPEDLATLVAEVERLGELLTWHATPQFEEDHAPKAEDPATCFTCQEPWPCMTRKAWTAPETDDPVVVARKWLDAPGVPSVSSSIRLVKWLMREVNDLRALLDPEEPSDGR